MTAPATRIRPLPGGIAPPARKRESLKEAIRHLPLPERLVIPLTQPGFAAPELCVEPGQRVLKGQLLARGAHDTGVDVHASTSGIVLAIESKNIPNASGLPEACAVLQPDGEERWLRLPEWRDFAAVDPEDLIERVRETGISGLGGAGVPTHLKLRAALGRVHTLVLNACECEPCISCDEALLREEVPEVVLGVQILLHAIKAERCVIAIEDSKPAAIRALQAAAATDPRIGVQVLPAQYPSGAEKQLIYMLSGTEIPAGVFPTDVGFLCHNVGTVRAIARAVVHGEALVSRIVTITGAAVLKPGNVEALIGTQMSHLLRACQWDEFSAQRFLMGGPLMGLELPHAELPVLKTTNCIVAATLDELPPPAPELACIRCGFCSEVCPARLLPQQLYWHARSGEPERAEALRLFDCIECGACAYVCPSHIPLVQYYRAAKGELREIHEKRAMADHSRPRFEFHQARKAREKLEEERRRAERAELAKSQQDAAAGNAAQAAIAAALARVKAKKAAQEQGKPEGDETS